MQSARITSYRDPKGRELLDARTFSKQPNTALEESKKDVGSTEQPGDISNTAAMRREAAVSTLVKFFTLPKKYPYDVFEGNGKLDSKGGFGVIVVGPFGSGKNSLVDQILKRDPISFELAVEHTSRAMRAGETNGKEYFFVTKEEFLEMAGRDEIVVWGDLWHSNSYYGYSINAIQSAFDNGKIPILVQGPHNIGPMKSALMKRGIPTVDIFVSPESKEALREEGGVERTLKVLDKRMDGAIRNNLAERQEINRAMLETFSDDLILLKNADGKLDEATVNFLSLVRNKKDEFVTKRIVERFGKVHFASAEFEETGKISDDFFSRHHFNANGRVAVIISGPSGVGKGTILERAFNDPDLNIGKAFSYTTRPPRQNEKDGKDYFFISKEEFEKMLQNDELHEWVFGANEIFYGNTDKQIQGIFDNGNDAIFDLDMHGTNFYRYIFGRMGVPYIDIFISPVPKDVLESPDCIEKALPVLEKRIRERGSGETEEQIQGRLKKAKEFLEAASSFTHIIENTEGNLDASYEQFKKLIS